MVSKDPERRQWPSEADQSDPEERTDCHQVPSLILNTFYLSLTSGENKDTMTFSQLAISSSVVWSINYVFFKPPSKT